MGTHEARGEEASEPARLDLSRPARPVCRYTLEDNMIACMCTRHLDQRGTGVWAIPDRRCSPKRTASGQWPRSSHRDQIPVGSQDHSFDKDC